MFIARQEIKAIRNRDTGILIAILLLGVIGAVLASIYHLPDTDDFSYVPNAVHFLSFPTSTMGNEIHHIYTGGDPILSVIASTSSPYEYSQSLLAHLLQTDFLTFYHIITVAWVGFTIPLVLFLMLTHFSDDTLNSALATLIVIAIMILLGETKYSVGSLSFTRLFQGKIVLFAAGLPLFISLSLDYLAIPSIPRWIYVVVAATALSGLSSSAFFLLPMLALGLGLAYEISTKISFRNFGVLVSYGATLIYPIVYGIYASQSVSRFREIQNPLLLYWPSDFIGHLKLLINPQRPITPLLFLIFLALAAIILKGFRRKFILVLVAIDFLFFLNPLAAEFWIQYVTGPSIYWRVFLVLPFSMLFGVVIIALLEKISVGSTRIRYGVVVLATLGLISLHFVPNSSSIYRRGGVIGLPRYKVRGDLLKVAQAVTEHAPSGPTLAPPEIAGIIGMLEGGHPQLHYGKKPLLDWISWGKAERRQRASLFTEGDEYRESDFRNVLQETEDLRVIVLKSDLIKDVTDILNNQGFSEKRIEGEYAILWR